MLGLQRSLYKEKGFIYIDVLIALVVLSVAIIAILYTYNTSLNVNKENDDLKTAVVLANNQLNFLKKEQKLMFFVNETPQYVFGLKISNDKILLN